MSPQDVLLRSLLSQAMALTQPAQSSTWEDVLQELAAEGLRPRAMEAYTSIIKTFRRFCPTSTGPGDVTPEVAVTFIRRYQLEGFTRSEASDAKHYKRSAKTVENMVRRMSGLWEKIVPKLASFNPWSDVKRPTVPKTVPVIPSDETVSNFYSWLVTRYPNWELLHAFVEVKMVAGCRLNDLCSLKATQFNSNAATLTISPADDKTHRERIVPLDENLSAKLMRTRGEVFLWEKFLPESKMYRPCSKTMHRDQFTPRLLYHAMKNIFREFPGKLRSHGLRKRAITLATLATGSVDATAEAFGLDPMTARKYYLDAKRAFDGTELLKKMAQVLKPCNQIPAKTNQI